MKKVALTATLGLLLSASMAQAGGGHRHYSPPPRHYGEFMQYQYHSPEVMLSFLLGGHYDHPRHWRKKHHYHKKHHRKHHRRNHVHHHHYHDHHKYHVGYGGSRCHGGYGHH